MFINCHLRHSCRKLRQRRGAAAESTDTSGGDPGDERLRACVCVAGFTCQGGIMRSTCLVAPRVAQVQAGKPGVALGPKGLMRCQLISRQEESGSKSGKKKLKNAEGPSMRGHICRTSEKTDKPQASGQCPAAQECHLLRPPGKDRWALAVNPSPALSPGPPQLQCSQSRPRSP